MFAPARPDRAGRGVMSVVGGQKFAKSSASMPDAVSDEVRRLILDGTIGPGERINVRDLERRLHVSHIPIREGIRMLQAEGLVETKPNIGAVATEISLSEVEDVYDLRRLVEPTVARRAVERMSDEHLALLHAALTELEGPASASATMDSGYIAGHWRFHRLLLAPGLTPTMERTLDRLWRVAERYLRLTHGAALPVADEQHRLMVELCEERRGEELAEVLTRHLHLTADTLQILYGAIRTVSPGQ